MKEGTPSFTAVAVGYFVLILGQTAYDLLPPGIITLQAALLEAVKLPWRDYYFLLLLRSPIGPLVSRFLRWLSGLFCKNGIEFVGFRKYFIDQRVREFLEKNEDKKPQALILAAGYDTLSLRLARQYPDASFWEIDHPSTGNFKNKIWRVEDKSKDPFRIIGEKPANLFHECVDLTQKNALAETLAAQNGNYNTSRPTIILMEGLLMYFTTPQVHSLFEEISKAVGPGSVATFDMMATKYDANGQQQPDIGVLTPLVSLIVKLKSEPWLVGLDPKILQDFVDKSATWSYACDVQPFGPAYVAAIQTQT